MRDDPSVVLLAGDWADYYIRLLDGWFPYIKR
jgi:hypothetical protein